MRSMCHQSHSWALTDGNFHGYPVDVVLWGSKAAGPGRQRYANITELYPSVHPPYVHGQPPTLSETL